MAANTVGVFTNDLQSAIKSAKVLVVGAGGIGCELLKNLVLTGFEDIEIIDLDTIDVSNLNRQFLFQKPHVGKSKAKVARESVLRFNPKANIVAHHDSIISNNYGVNYFKKFCIVLNALDNRAARNHVNRLCLAAEVPLVESGTAGYSGQVELILKGKTKCYECDPKAPLKTYPGCTIRNTPSEHIHCIVWAKHLFNQLFGEDDPDEDVSPDTADPEAAGDAIEVALKSDANKGNVERVSTRAWAQSTKYDPKKLFMKLFNEDINYLLKMENLWRSRRPPQPLELSNLPDATEGSSSSLDQSNTGMKDQRLWSVAECADIFTKSVEGLKAEFQSLTDGGHLTWDKDNKSAMDFVASSANLRAHIYAIPLKSKFDIKSMAGNIIPAIATSNAIIAGLVVMHAINILREEMDRCQSVYLRVCPNHRGHLIVPERCLIPPNPQCRVCSKTPQVALCTNINKMTCKEFEVNVLKNNLNMAAPDVILSASGSVIISSDEGETEHNDNKTLKEIGVVDGSVLIVDDYLQNYELKIIITHREMGKDEPEFLVVGNIEELQPKKDDKLEKNGDKSRKAVEEDDDEDDDIEMLSFEEEVTIGKKRKQVDLESSLKKRKTDEVETPPSGSYNDPITL